MRRFVPHCTFFAGLVGIALIGLAFNVQPIAVFVGTFAALCTDPLLAVLSLAIGALLRNVLVLFVCAIVAGIVFSLYIAYLNEPIGAELTALVAFARVCVVTALALLANVIRLVALRTVKVNKSRVEG